MATPNIIFSDFPDVDVIRVGNVYYMISTTMHFFPSCAILQSYNLVDWEIINYVSAELDGTSGQRLQDGQGIYGKGIAEAGLYGAALQGKLPLCHPSADRRRRIVPPPEGKGYFGQTL